MINIILYLIVILSFFGILFILGRKIPVLAQLSEKRIVVLSKQQGLLKKTTIKIRKIDYRSHQASVFLYFKTFFVLIKKGLLKIKMGGSWGLSWIGQRFKDLGRGLKSISQNIAKQMPKIKIGLQKIILKIKESNKKEPQPIEETVVEPEEEKSETELLEEAIKEESSLIEEKEETGKLISIADLEKPIQEEQKWIDLIVENPKNIIAYKELGLFYWKQKNYQDASASLEVAVKLGSKDKKIKETLKKIAKEKN